MNEGEEIRFIDLYSGVGGFRKGLEDCGGSQPHGEDSRSKRDQLDGSRRENEHGSPYSHKIDLERASEERRVLRQQILHGYFTDIAECLECGREATIGYISQEPPRGSFGLEKAGHRGGKSLSKRGRVGDDIRSEGIGSSPDTERRETSLKQLPEDNRFRCVWSCDNDKYANQIYAKHFGEANHYTGDIRGVDPRYIPDFDLLCAGFPCQSFSVAGPRTGFQDTRGTLFFEISRIAEAKRPQMLLLENVKGLLSNDRGQTFKTILQELGRIGYWTEWQVLNSKHHGVPQNRERVFIIGHLRNGSSRPIFPIGETDEMAKEDGGGRSPVQPEVSTAIDGSYYKGVDRHGQRTVVLDTFNKGGAKEGKAYSLKTNPSPTSSAVLAILTDNLGGNIKDRVKDATEAPAWTLGGSATKVAISFTNPHDSEEERRVNLGDTSRAVKPPYGNQQPLILHNIYGGFKEGIRTFEEHSPTIRTAKGGGHIPSVMTPIGSDKPTVRAGGKGSLDRHAWDTLTDGFRIRRLTPVECERLQGFPDGWTAQGICKKGDTVWTGNYRTCVEIDEDGLEVTRYRPIMTKAKSDGIYPISDTQRYRALGNAVTTRVITFLGRRIMESWNEDDLVARSPSRIK